MNFGSGICQLRDMVRQGAGESNAQELAVSNESESLIFWTTTSVTCNARDTSFKVYKGGKENHPLGKTNKNNNQAHQTDPLASDYSERIEFH
jgi:hypothetical protein